jgi:hypothetical protein
MPEEKKKLRVLLKGVVSSGGQVEIHVDDRREW